MTIKLMMLGRRRPGQTLSEHRAHMQDVHGRLVLDYIAADPDNAPRRYVQNHAFDGIYAGGEGQVKAFALGFDFVTEVWFPDLASLKASRETQFYLERLQPDESQMVDTATVIGLPVAEEIIAAPASSGPFIKVFLSWNGTKPAWTALAEALGPALECVLGQCRNTPVVPAPVEAIDEFWWPGEAEGIAFAKACRDAIHARLPAEHGSFTLTIAREFVLHAG
jgi:EthD domain